MCLLNKPNGRADALAWIEQPHTTSHEKDKDLHWCNVEDQPEPKVFNHVAMKRFFSSYKIDFEVHTGWISSLGECSDSLQCTKQLQDTVFKFLISHILVDF